MADPQVDYSVELGRFPMFRGLTQEQLRGVRVNDPVVFSAGSPIFYQDDPITKVYLILSGEVELVRKGNGAETDLIYRAGPDQTLGRLELDVPEGQLGEARAKRRTTVLTIDKDVLVRLRNAYPSLQSHFDRSEVIGHLRAAPFFAPLSDIEIKWLSDIAIVSEANAKQIFYEIGETARFAYVLRQGRVRLESGDGNKRWISAGSVFGDRSAITQQKREALAVAESRCFYYEIPADDLQNVVKRHERIDWLNDPISIETYLKQTNLFSRLNDDEVAHLAGYTMQLHLRQTHRKIVNYNVSDNYFYVLIHGYAAWQTASENGALNAPVQIIRGASFGAGSLLLSEAAEASVETTSPTDWLRIHREDFSLFLQAFPHVQDRLNIDPHLRDRFLGAKKMHSWQQEGEIVYLETHRHWVVLLRNLSALIALVVVLSFVALWLDSLLSLTWQPFTFFGCLLTPAITWIILDYLNDYHIVTSRRVAHQEKVILISEKLHAAPLDQIQELRIERKFWAQVFGYGHLVISTAADPGRIDFDFLPNPEATLELLQQESAKAKATVRVESEEMIRRQLQDKLHLGLEERLDSRALLEAPAKHESAKQKRIGKLLGLQHGDDDKLIWRKHWLGLVIVSLVPLVVTFLCTLFLVAAITDLLFPGANSALHRGLIILALLLLGGSAFWLWYNVTDWINDTYILTNQYIEHSEIKPLWVEDRRSVTSLDRVQNVRYVKPDPLAYIFGFGHVSIQTAAEEGLILFRFVPQPDEVQTEIFRRIENFRSTQAEIRRKERKSDFADWLAAYNQLMEEERTRYARG
ncbi:MAG: cyclic nucleotide-binding domain-containing protein [Caldilineales bacterium]|nr:cyclic nucleotide-binding domain-containing protein [Caldilineales bacterium]